MSDPHMTAAALRPFIQAALAEDVGGGDATTLAVVGAADRARGVFAARVDCVVAGLPVALLLSAFAAIATVSAEIATAQPKPSPASVFEALR